MSLPEDRPGRDPQDPAEGDDPFGIARIRRMAEAAVDEILATHRRELAAQARQLDDWLDGMMPAGLRRRREARGRWLARRRRGGRPTLPNQIKAQRLAVLQRIDEWKLKEPYTPTDEACVDALYPNSEITVTKVREWRKELRREGLYTREDTPE